MDEKHEIKKKNNSVLDVLKDILNIEIKWFNQGFSDRKKEKFYMELSVLLSSGVDLRTTLEIISEEQTNESDQSMYKGIHDHLVAGLSLSEAMEKTGRFGNYELYSVRIGEESSRMELVLKELSLFFARKVKQKRQIISAVTYPTLVLVTALGAVIFMLQFVVPMFQDIFTRFQGELPPLTKFIFGLSGRFLNDIFVFIGIVLILILLNQAYRKKTILRKLKAEFLLKLPWIGRIVRKIYLSRFCQAMALLTGTHTPLIRALSLTREIMQFYPYEKAIDRISEEILQGKLLHQSMQQFPIFEKRVVSLTRVAEEVNQLDTLFTRLNEQYSAELEHDLSLIGTILEPGLIIIVGVLVALILIGMYLPLFQMGSSIM